MGPSIPDTLRVRLLVMLVLALLPVLGVLLYVGYEVEASTRKEAGERAEHLAGLAAKRFDIQLQAVHDKLQVLARVPAVRTGAGTDCRRFLQKVAENTPSLANIGVIGFGGQVPCSVRSVRAEVNAAALPSFTEAMVTGRFTVGGFHIGGITHEPVVVLVQPFKGAEAPGGAVFAALSLDWADRFAGRTHLPTGASMTLMDGNGRILARSPRPSRWQGKTAPHGSTLARLLPADIGVGDGPGL
ncbi:MAG TPA: cache domain-containing protein, partial [Gammaproteobacteria bacterium]|nr:cache domain-containing protein [Gammaproteobacteria bacterium]